MGKIEKAILERVKVGNQVFPSQLGVGVSGSRAVAIATRLAACGKVKEFRNSSCYTKIGNNWDGSWKYGMVFEGVVILNDA
jgi:hypothetical protein